jgi:hypothetical protein
MQGFADFGNGERPVTIELFCCGDFPRCVVKSRPPAFSAPRPRRFQACHRSLCDEVSLKLGKGAEDMKHELAGCGCGINVLRDAFKRNALLFECRYGLYQMFEGAAKPVKPPDNEGVTLPQMRERLR